MQPEVQKAKVCLSFFLVVRNLKFYTAVKPLLKYLLFSLNQPYRTNQLDYLNIGRYRPNASRLFLKFQQLTFASVGVALVLGIVYVLGRMISNLWRDGKGRGRWSSKRWRREGWEEMRRIERLLITHGGGGQQGRQIETALFSDMINEDEEDARLTGILFLLTCLH